MSSNCPLISSHFVILIIIKLGNSDFNEYNPTPGLCMCSSLSKNTFLMEVTGPDLYLHNLEQYYPLTCQ